MGATMTVAMSDDEEYPDRSAEIAPLDKLRREVRSAARELGQEEARFLVDLYYELQEHRIALDGQERSLVALSQPHDVAHHFATQMRTLEKQMVSVLDAFTSGSVPGEFLRSQIGIGPVISAGLLAHIDIERADTVGKLWKFAGQAPPKVTPWNKGERRPWNAKLKVICWRLGDSFVKVSGRDGSDGKEPAFYGLIYKERKLLEVSRNENGDFAAQAAESLATRKISDGGLRTTYESGKLPAGRLDLRARRYAVKMLLAHLHEVLYVDRYGALPPKPWIITVDDAHTHEVVPPHLPGACLQLRAADGRPTAEALPFTLKKQADTRRQEADEAESTEVKESTDEDDT